MPAQQLPDLTAHPEILPICAVLAVLMVVVPPLLEIRSWRAKRERFDRWLAAGPHAATTSPGVSMSGNCPLCGSSRIRTSTVASFAEQMRIRPVQCTGQGLIRYVEARCGICGTTIERRKETA